MSVIEIIKEEHEWMEQELVEIETILDSELINYPNLIHVLKELNLFLEEHVKKEQLMFSTLESRGVKTPLGRLVQEQAVLRRYKQILFDAIYSGSDFRTRKTLQEEGQMFISKIRKHIQEQEWVFYALPELEVESFLQVHKENSKMIVGN